MARSPGGVGEVATRFATCGEPLPLLAGGSIAPVTLAYEVYGELNADRSNAILVFHALSGSQHAAGYNPSVPGVGDLWQEECHVGWWDGFIGPDRALDTNRFSVICANYLGGCYGSTGPASVNPATGKPYGSAFPRLTLADIVDSQVCLLNRLGIQRLHAAIGGSQGGMLALSLATRYPDRVATVIPLAAGIGVTILQRIHNLEQIYAIERDPNFNGGDYYDRPRPDAGLALARMIGHKTYVSLDVLEHRARREIVQQAADFSHYRLNHPVESYMLHQGRSFVRRFDANTYLRIKEAWQRFDLAKEAGAADLGELLARCRHQRHLIFSIDSDVCSYPEEQSELEAHLRRVGVPCRHITIHSDKGHDAFLLETALIGPYLKDTLERPW